MTLLEKAILIAVQAHAGQKDKAGLPYICHPLRLMMKMDTEEAKIAAVLHDVVEDTDVTLEDLRREGFPEPILEAVRLLTHEEGIDYEAYVLRLKPNALARRVKLADLEDNSSIHRITNLLDPLKKAERYFKAWQMLQE